MRSSIWTRAFAKRLAVALLGAASCLGASLASGAEPSFRLLETLNSGSPFMSVTDISGDGSVVVGTCNDEDGSPAVYRWTAGGGPQRIADLDAFPINRVPGVSRDGKTIVGSYTPDGDDVAAFRWTSTSGLKRLSSPYDSSQGYYGVRASQDGKIAIGFSDRTAGTDVIVWSGNTPKKHSLGDFFYSILDCSSDGRTTIGWGVSPTGSLHPYFWSAADGIRSIGDFDDDEAGFPLACSPTGDFVVGNGNGGRFDTASGFTWNSREGVRRLKAPAGVPEPYASGAYGCSDDGSIVVGGISPLDGNDKADDANLWGAYVWIDGDPFQLADLLRDSGISVPADVELDSALKCSADGSVIVGSATVDGDDDPQDDQAFRVVVPGLVQGSSSRPYGAAANAYALYAYQYAAYALSEPNGYSQYGVDAYTYAIYGYIYSLYAGDTVSWGEGTTESEAVGDYLDLRYYQYVFQYYAQINAEQRYYASPGDSSLYSYYFALLATAYGSYDLGS